MREDLKPCPFCGGAAELDPLQGFQALGTGAPGNRAAVYCTECSADIGLCHGDVPELDDETRTGYVVDLWNRRTIPAGYVLVPAKPTEAMLDQGEHVNSEWLNDDAPLGQRRYREPAKAVYIAMIAAAREPKP